MNAKLQLPWLVAILAKRVGFASALFPVVAPSQPCHQKAKKRRFFWPTAHSSVAFRRLASVQAQFPLAFSMSAPEIILHKRESNLSRVWKLSARRTAGGVLRVKMWWGHTDDWLSTNARKKTQNCFCGIRGQPHKHKDQFKLSSAGVGKRSFSFSNGFSFSFYTVKLLAMASWFLQKLWWFSQAGFQKAQPVVDSHLGMGWLPHNTQSDLLKGVADCWPGSRVAGRCTSNDNKNQGDFFRIIGLRIRNFLLQSMTVLGLLLKSTYVRQVEKYLCFWSIGFGP